MDELEAIEIVAKRNEAENIFAEEFVALVSHNELLQKAIRKLSVENEIQIKKPARFQQWENYDRLVEDLAKVNPGIADCYRRF